MSTNDGCSLGSEEFQSRRNATRGCQLSKDQRPSMNPGCYHTDMKLVECHCRPQDDFCFVEVAAGVDADPSSKAMSCLQEHVGPLRLRRGVQCLFRPKKWVHPPIVSSRTSADAYGAWTAWSYAAAASSMGAWDCASNRWVPLLTSGPPPLIGDRARQLPRELDAIATFGDSLASGLATGLNLVVSGYSPSAALYHNRHSQAMVDGAVRGARTAQQDLAERLKHQPQSCYGPTALREPCNPAATRVLGSFREQRAYTVTEALTLALRLWP